MFISVVGLNHVSAPLELRERLTYTSESRAAALSLLKQTYSETVILDTCNRSEIYTLSTRDSDPTIPLRDFLREFHRLSPPTLQPHLYTHANQAAVSHLFAIASGIDSLVVGEAQVLSQVREGFEFAVSHRTCGPIFSALFRHALRVGKRARSETHIGHGAVSLSSLAIERVQQVMGSLRDRTALLIGTGKMSTLAARNLQALGVLRLFIANRTMAHAEELAQQVGGVAIPFEQVTDALGTCDVVFTSTGAPSIILPYAIVASAMNARQRPMCIVDLALPRDVDPAVANLSYVHLIDLDDLQILAANNLTQRRAEVRKVQAMIAEEVDAFWRWLQTLNVAPTIAALRARAEQIRQSELADHLGRLKNLTPQEKRVIESMTASIVGRLLHEPTLRLKARASDGDGAQHAATLRELFGLDENHEP